MTRDEAIAAVSEWVAARYPVVPPVAMAIEFTNDLLNEEILALNPGSSRQEAESMLGKWFVSFFCSWDTDAWGMPLRLCLIVDDDLGSVRVKSLEEFNP